jgi:protein CLEC16A
VSDFALILFLIIDSYFLEKHMLAHFLNILSQKTGQQVKVQLLQTLSILITGIKSETHLCTPPSAHPPTRPDLIWCVISPPRADYMLSNNHINELITHRFDFSNEVRVHFVVACTPFCAGHLANCS